MNHKELKKKLEELSPDDYELWEERAAIMEYDGSMTRKKAEIEAYKCLLKYHKQKRA